MNHTRARYRPILSILFAASFSLSPAFADDGYYGGSGATVSPLNNDDVEMLSMDVTMTNRPKDWDVECEYHFRGPLVGAEVQMGFPDHRANDYDEDDDATTIRNFATSIDGVPVEAVVKKGVLTPNLGEENYARVFVFTVPFDKLQERVVKHHYTFGHSGDSSGYGTISFALKTGALWKGPIRKGVIRIRGINAAFIVAIAPIGYTIEGDTISWNFTNLDPAEDVHVRWHDRSSIWLSDAKSRLSKLSKAPLSDNDTKDLVRLLSSGIQIMRTWIRWPDESLEENIANNESLRSEIADIFTQLVQNIPSDKLPPDLEFGGKEISYILNGNAAKLATFYLSFLNQPTVFQPGGEGPESLYKRIAKRGVVYAHSPEVAFRAYETLFRNYKAGIREDNLDTVAMDYANACIAVQQYDKAIAVYKNSVAPHYSAQQLRHIGDKFAPHNPTFSRKCYEASIESAADDPSLGELALASFQSMARLYERSNNNAEALAIYKRMLTYVSWIESKSNRSWSNHDRVREARLKVTFLSAQQP